jgi:hypothetical protein
MAAKKKRRTAKQIAATKKMIAARKKQLAAKRKKNPRPALSAAEKKKLAASKKYVGRKSQATKKAPTKRLRARRKANVKPGTYPNPRGHKNYYIVYDSDGKRRYFDGADFVARKKGAAIWHCPTSVKRIAQKLADKTGKNIGILTEVKK